MRFGSPPTCNDVDGPLAVGMNNKTLKSLLVGVEKGLYDGRHFSSVVGSHLCSPEGVVVGLGNHRPVCIKPIWAFP